MPQKPYDQYIKSLAEKWLNGTITSDEAQEFARWYNQFQDGEEIFLDETVAPNEKALKEKIYKAVAKKLNEENKKPYVQTLAISRKWFKYAAAVVISGIVAISAYIFLTAKKEKIVVASNALKSNDRQPGGNKAMLTLANGSVIILDSAANGELVKDSTGKVTKLADGRIAYISAKADTTKMLSLTVPRGGQYQLTLPDGTQVWLNSASSISFPSSFTRQERNVQITGEVYFEVAHRKTLLGNSMPFKVKANGIVVEVLGTHFNVNAYNDESSVKTTLIEGSVRVEQIALRQSTVIKPGQQAQVPINSAAIRVFSNIDISQIMAWKDGFFEFDDADPATVLRQVGRWYDVDIIFENAQLSEKLGGRISKNLPLSKLLKLLELSGVKTKLEGRRLTIIS